MGSGIPAPQLTGPYCLPARLHTDPSRLPAPAYSADPAPIELAAQQDLATRREANNNSNRGGQEWTWWLESSGGYIGG